MVAKRPTSTPKTAPSSAGLFDNQLAQAIKDSAQQIWLAGLGAFAKAQNGRGKFFETLIAEGTSVHRKTEAATGGRLAGATVRTTEMAEEIGSRTNARWDKLESIFEQRTSRALARLGVPTAKEVEALAARVDALAAAVARFHGEAAAAKTASRKARGAGGKTVPAKRARRSSGER